MATHVGRSNIFRNIGKILAELSHGQSIHISPKSDTEVFALGWCLPLQVYNESCGLFAFPGNFSNVLLLDTKREKKILDPLMSFKLLKGDFWVLVKFPPEGD